MLLPELELLESRASLSVIRVETSVSLVLVAELGEKESGVGAGSTDIDRFYSLG